MDAVWETEKGADFTRRVYVYSTAQRWYTPLCYLAQLGSNRYDKTKSTVYSGLAVRCP